MVLRKYFIVLRVYSRDAILKTIDSDITHLIGQDTLNKINSR